MNNQARDKRHNLVNWSDADDKTKQTNIIDIGWWIGFMICINFL